MGNYININAAWRDGDDPTSVAIYKDSQTAVDFVTGEKYDILGLVSLILGGKAKAEKFLKDKLVDLERTNSQPLLKSRKILDPELITDWQTDYSYWANRRISVETLQLFGGGVSTKGKTAQRYVFPIYSNDSQYLIGVAGRDLYVKSKQGRPKWKLIGDKSKWTYPLHLNRSIIEESKQIYLVESIGDGLALWDAGIKNFLITFGVELSQSIISVLIMLDPSKIYVSLNNDVGMGNNEAGNKAAIKARTKLKNYFDDSQIIVKLPTRKDFGEMSKEEITAWAK